MVAVAVQISASLEAERTQEEDQSQIEDRSSCLEVKRLPQSWTAAWVVGSGTGQTEEEPELKLVALLAGTSLGSGKVK